MRLVNLEICSSIVSVEDKETFETQFIFSRLCIVTLFECIENLSYSHIVFKSILMFKWNALCKKSFGLNSGGCVDFLEVSTLFEEFKKVSPFAFCKSIADTGCPSS